METIEQLYEIIRNEAEKDPETKKVMERVFPVVFESGVYCKIGTTFKRKEYPDNDYALIKWNGEVRILNITCNSFWDSKRNLKVSKLKDPEGKTLTISEFKELSGFETLDTFVFPSIPKPGTILERLLAKEPATYYNLEIAEVIYREDKGMQDICNTSLFYITEDGNILHTWTTEEQLNQNFKDGNLKFTITSDKGCSDM